jgi:hypothetical protein
MYRALVRSLAAVVLLVTCMPGAEGAAIGVDAEVQAGLDQMHRWLGQSEKGRQWRRFLRSADLENQLARGSEADREIVAEISRLYSGDTPGLEHPRFAAVRQAITKWLVALNEPTELDVASEVQRVKEGFHALDAAQLEKAKTTLREAVRHLEEFLALGSAPKQLRWKEYLHWDRLARQLGGDSSPQVEELGSVAARFYSGEQGLELPPFARVRRALRRYLEVLVFANDPQAGETLAGRLDTLAGHLGAYAQDPEFWTAGEIGLTLGWLEQLGQANELVAKVRRAYSRPNVFLRVSDATIVAATARPIAETTPIRDLILGTTIRGQGMTRGQVEAQLIPSRRSAILDIVLTGTTDSDTVGYNGPVTILSTGQTQLRGRTRLVIDPAGVSVQPAEGWCQTTTRFRDISAGRRLAGPLIEQLAWGRALRDKSRAEWIAARHAEGWLAERIDRQSGQLALAANRRFAQEVRNPLQAAEVFPQWLQVSSTVRDVRVEALQAAPWQLAAPGGPPADPGAEITGRLHQSLLNNATETLLADMTLTDERLVQLLEERKLHVPDELTIHPDKDPWAITFTNRHPVRIEFADDQVIVAIRCQRFRRADDQPFDRLVEISAKYTLQIGPVAAILTRQGDVQVDFLQSQGRLSAAQIGIRTFLRRKFNALLKEQFASEGLKLPENLQQRLGQLYLHHLVARDGWLTLGWSRTPQAAEAIAAK